MIVFSSTLTQLMASTNSFKYVLNSFTIQTLLIYKRLQNVPSFFVCKGLAI